MKAARSRGTAAARSALIALTIGVAVCCKRLLSGSIADRRRATAECTDVPAGCAFDFGLYDIMMSVVNFMAAPLAVFSSTSRIRGDGRAGTARARRTGRFYNEFDPL